MHHTSTSESHTEGASQPEAGLPCLNSNISIETSTQTPSTGTEGVADGRLPRIPRLSTQHRKSAFILKESVQQLADKYGLERLGFLTLTFADHVLSTKQAQARLNSLLSNVIKTRYQDYLGVFERQKSGRIHYHLLVALDIDIRTDFDFDQVQEQNYKSASPGLRREWAFWRSTAPKYRFGRTELMPIKSSTEAISKYVGKYISKHMEARKPIDKGARLVRYSQGARCGTTRFQFVSDGSRKWRQAVGIFAQVVQDHHPDKKISSLSDLSEVLGKRWAYHHRDQILAISELLC